MAQRSNISRRLAPEEIRPGMFIVVLGMVHEFIPPQAWESTPFVVPKPYRIECTDCADGDPLRVVAVCLPFVQAESAEGHLRALDVRSALLARVSETYALEVFTRPTKKRCDCDD